MGLRYIIVVNMDTKEFLMKRYNVNSLDTLPIRIHGSRFREFVKLIRLLKFRVGAEIGVSRGLYSKALLSSNPELFLYCIDPWLAYDNYVEYHGDSGQIMCDENFKICVERLKNFEGRFKFIKKFSMDAVKEFKDNFLDFVFIDGNHSFEYVINDIAEWSKKVRKGGIVAGHDYWTSSLGKRNVNTTDYIESVRLCQVEDAVNAWTKANRISPWFVLDGDSCPSYFWVKEW